jgi:adenylate cyclase
MEPAGSGRVERRLAAILAADVAGYSRLMGADEEGTLAALKALRRELADPKIKEHRGRIVKTTGDGLLIEFASVVDAVRCAVEVQREMAERNADVPPDRRIEFRMGINIGDIIKDGRDIYGDGVNLAARLEALAEPGGICASRAVREQVRDKLDFSFEDMGEQQLKNIARPIRVHRILLGETPGRLEPASVSTKLPLVLPDKPSIAVLPFANMSGDPEQEYFADGMVEEIITVLSRIVSIGPERPRGRGLVAKTLDRSHDVLLLGHDGVAQLLHPVELLVHHPQDPRKRHQRFDAGIPRLCLERGD